MVAIVQLMTKILTKNESEITIELDEIVFSKKHGYKICIMHLVGKNSFPKMTAEEILSNPEIMHGLSREDIILITRLDMEIKQKQNQYKLVEMDRNGTILFENNVGEKLRYSEKVIPENLHLLDNMMGRDSYRIGYQMGFKDGFKSWKQKQQLVRGQFVERIFSLLSFKRK